ncbi:MAG: hypothetical protein ACUVRQ_08275 [Thermoanaerobaculaceae bacterium]
MLGLLVVAEHGSWGSRWRGLGSGAWQHLGQGRHLPPPLTPRPAPGRGAPGTGTVRWLHRLYPGGCFRLALWLDARLPMPESLTSPLLFPVALFATFVGLFLIVSRRIALSQVVGSLVLENGIFTFGLSWHLHHQLGTRSTLPVRCS